MQKSESYSGLSQTTKTECFAKLLSGFYPFSRNILYLMFQIFWIRLWKRPFKLNLHGLLRFQALIFQGLLRFFNLLSFLQKHTFLFGAKANLNALTGNMISENLKWKYSFIKFLSPIHSKETLNSSRIQPLDFELRKIFRKIPMNTVQLSPLCYFAGLVTLKRYLILRGH